jgi:MATE family multidrug resistance protein
MVGSTLLYRYLRRRRQESAAEEGNGFFPRHRIFELSSLLRTLSANFDIMLRTLLLVFSFAFFTNQGARFGDSTLAANHILLQMISFAAFFLDGFAYVAEALVGQAVGATSRKYFDTAVRKTSLLALFTAFFLAVWIWLLGPVIISMLTSLPGVRAEAQGLLFLAAIYVGFSFPAYQLDGIFIGAGRTAAMRNAALLSLGVYLLAWWFLMPRFGVGGLWWAMIIYVAARADALLLFYPALRASIGGKP